MRRIIFYAPLIAYLTIRLANAEVIDIKMLIPQISSQDSIIKRFAVELDQAYYYSECNADYLAITTGENDNTKVRIFNWQQQIQAMDNVYFSSFVRGLDGYCVYTHNEDFLNDYRIFDFSGDLLNSFSGLWSYLTPGGGYIYTKASVESWKPLVIYDLVIYDREISRPYKFPIEGPYLADALSDSLMMVVEGRDISLWNIKNKSIAWKTEIPDTSFSIDDSFDIVFSPSRRLALIRNINACYFIDAGGKIVWSNHDYNGGYKIAISSSDTLVSFVSGGYSHLVFVLYSISGSKITEADCYLGPDPVVVYTVDKTTFVNEHFQLAGFAVKELSTGRKLYITGICLKMESEYKVFAVDGLWFYLKKNDREGTLAGFGNSRSEIVGYSVISK